MVDIESDVGNFLLRLAYVVQRQSCHMHFMFKVADLRQLPLQLRVESQKLRLHNRNRAAGGCVSQTFHRATLI